jgi:ferrous iron transport protein B
MNIVLIGNPNCGKTSLFNALTGEKQRVGNWSGVTVEKKTGDLFLDGLHCAITDLPGIYSLTCVEDQSSQDERIAAIEIAFGKADLIINVIDSCHLERHLYLTSQLLELGTPVLIALNMVDVATKSGISVDQTALGNLLHCPVIPIQAHRNLGIEQLKKALLNRRKPVAISLKIPQEIYQNLTTLESTFFQGGIEKKLAKYLAYRAIEGDTVLKTQLSFPIIQPPMDRDTDILMADARYQAIHEMAARTVERKQIKGEFLTTKLDNFLLHRYWSIPIFFFVMYVMFLFAINIGGAFQDVFDQSSDIIFVKGTAVLLTAFHSPDWLIALLAQGVGKGLNTTLTFIPVLASMYFFLSFLEATGYMARAAFIVDRLMRHLGLPGKSFVPMIVGFGCNVPAIMGARILESDKDRVLTILMSPFMSCSARLAIYTVFVSAFFPTGGQNIVFSLYLIGILMAVLTGLFLRKTYFHGQISPLIMELPPYHLPTLKRLCHDTYSRLRHFIFRAGKIIIPICILLGFLNAMTIHGINHGLEASSNSLLSWIGHLLTPIFYPMGITAENWPATVGLLTGMLAKEVVIGSLNSLYSQVGHLTPIVSAYHSFDLWGGLYQALRSIPENFSQLGHAIVNPIGASVPNQELGKPVYGIIYQFFGSKIAAYAYLVFILLYIPCISTMAAIKQEASSKWMWFSIGWSLFVAYGMAVMFYQIGTLLIHPLESILWLLAIALGSATILFGFNSKANSKRTSVC